MANIKKELLVPRVSVFRGDPSCRFNRDDHIPQKRRSPPGKTFAFLLTKGQDVGRTVNTQKPAVKEPDFSVVDQKKGKSHPLPPKQRQDFPDPPNELRAGNPDSPLAVFNRNLETAPVVQAAGGGQWNFENWSDSKRSG